MVLGVFGLEVLQQLAEQPQSLQVQLRIQHRVDRQAVVAEALALQEAVRELAEQRQPVEMVVLVQLGPGVLREVVLLVPTDQAVHLREVQLPMVAVAVADRFQIRLQL